VVKVKVNWKDTYDRLAQEDDVVHVRVVVVTRTRVSSSVADSVSPAHEGIDR
jgi:hypothetical protein